MKPLIDYDTILFILKLQLSAQKAELDACGDSAGADYISKESYKEVIQKHKDLVKEKEIQIEDYLNENAEYFI